MAAAVGSLGGPALAAKRLCMRRKAESSLPLPIPAVGEMKSEAEIDEVLAGSFPASDPPSWTLGTDQRTTEYIAMKTMKIRLNRTKNDLSEQTRRKVIGLLNQHLADALDLQLQAKQAHWNVKGPSFIALHELFDKVAEELEGFADEIAERAVALGGVAVGTVRAAAKSSRLSEPPLHISAGHAHVEALSGALADFGKSIREAIETAARAGDADTADLFTEVSRGLDKLLWFVEAHTHE